MILSEMKRTILLQQQNLPNEEEPLKICPECDGEGFLYFKWDDKLEKDVGILPEDYVTGDPDYDRQYCPMCHGNKYLY
jgi:hypothetical protein